MTATISAQRILELLKEIEAGAPVDFSACAIDAAAARQLVASHLADLHAHLVRFEARAEAREALLLATTARVMLDNIALQVRAVGTSGVVAGGELGALLERLGVSGD